MVLVAHDADFKVESSTLFNTLPLTVEPGLVLSEHFGVKFISQITRMFESKYSLG